MKRGTSEGTGFVASVFGRVAFVATALCAALAPTPSLAAATWMGADGNEYTALEYLKGAGAGGYVVCTNALGNIVPAGTDTVKVKFKTPGLVSWNGALFCARKSTGTTASNPGNQFTCYQDNSSLRIDRYYTQKTASNVLSVNSEYLLSINFATSDVTLNDSSLDLSLGTESYTPGSPLVLFGLCTYSNGKLSITTPGSGDKDTIRGRNYIHYFELYDSSGNLKHCLMPAKNTSDTAGFYDTVNGVFYPQEGSALTVAARGVVGSGVKWTGRGDGVSMSDGANWEGGVAPAAGDELDFTLAPPLAVINANIDATFGKVWLDDGEIPAFTNALRATSINYLTAMQVYDAATADFTFTLEAPSGRDFTWNGGTAANWGDAGVWTYGGDAADWYDNNNAFFSTANATATLTADVTALSLVFNADATIATNGTDEATLAVPTASVASGVTATISAPTDSALEKTGVGTLVLESSRSAVTTLSEGTLVMSGGGTTLDWPSFTLGTDAAKPVALRFENGAAPANIPSSWYIGAVAGVTSTVSKASGDWTARTFGIGTGTEAVSTFVNEGGDLSFNLGASVNTFVIGGTGAELSTMVISNGTVTVSYTGGNSRAYVGSNSEGVLTVTGGGVFTAQKSLFVANNAKGTLNVLDGGRVSVAESIVFDRASLNGDSAVGIVNLGVGGVIEAQSAYLYSNPEVLPATFNFDGGTFRKASGSGGIFPSHGVAVTVGASGGMIDNNGLDIAIPCTMTGAGGMTLSGSGITTISADQAYRGTTTVSNGTTLAVTGIAFAGSVAFESDSALDIANYNGTTALTVATGVTFPESGTVALTFDGGAFPQGVYAICSAIGLTAADAAMFAPSAGGETVAWSVSGNTLVLTVGEVSGNYWTGLAGDGKMSTAGNWLNGVPAEGADIDLTVVSSATTIDADAGRTFGAVTMGAGVITFTNAMAATSFSDTSKISIASDSTVTVDGDLVFDAATGTKYICHSFGTGGVFVVTGDIILAEGTTGLLRPCVSYSSPGRFAAKGLQNNQTGKGSGEQNYGRTFMVTSGGEFYTWEIGENGLSGSNYFLVSGISGASAKIIAVADFTVSSRFAVANPLEIDTAGHEIRLGDGTSGGIYNGQDTGMTTIAGSGRVVADYDVDDLTPTTSEKTNAFTVAASATLALVPGTDLGMGMVTVEDGGTLEVAASGTATLNGGLTLDDGAALAFNITERANAPILALAEGTEITFGETTAVAVKVSGTVWPKGGEKVLTTCGGFGADGVSVSLAADTPEWVKGVSVDADGNIVLDVKPKGMMIIVK